MIFKNIESSLYSWLQQLGVESELSGIIADYITFTLMILVSILTFFVARKIFLNIIHRMTAKSKTNWDNVLAQQKFFKLLAYLVPAYIIYTLTPVILESYPRIVSAIQVILTIYMIITVILVINAFLNSIAIIYQDFQVAKTRPIKGYVQIIKIILYVIAGITIIAILFDKNPLGLLGGLGAFSAVLLLVFKDPIMGFVGRYSVVGQQHAGSWRLDIHAKVQCRRDCD